MREGAKQPERPAFGGSIVLFYAVAVLFLVGFYFLRWPIVAGDTDLWYHLSGGRYFFQHHALPDSSFFSFLRPQRTYVDYYWLFQALAYWIYRSFGYPGLIALRAALFLSTVSLIGLYLFRYGRRYQSPIILVLFFAAFSLLLLRRSTVLRPHLFTNLMIPLFLLLLEEGSWRKLIWLPLLGILWMNLHGIAYPVMLLIVGVYTFDRLWQSRRDTQGKSKKLWSSAALLIAMVGVVFCTPHGPALLAVPWRSTRAASLYIDELRPLSFQDLTSVSVSGLVLSYPTLFNLLLLAAVAALILALRSRTCRLPPIVLFAAGCYLLSEEIGL